MFDDYPSLDLDKPRRIAPRLVLSVACNARTNFVVRFKLSICRPRFVLTAMRFTMEQCTPLAEDISAGCATAETTGLCLDQWGSRRCLVVQSPVENTVSNRQALWLQGEVEILGVLNRPEQLSRVGAFYICCSNFVYFSVTR